MLAINHAPLSLCVGVCLSHKTEESRKGEINILVGRTHAPNSCHKGKCHKEMWVVPCFQDGRWNADPVPAAELGVGVHGEKRRYLIVYLEFVLNCILHILFPLF